MRTAGPFRPIMGCEGRRIAKTGRAVVRAPFRRPADVEDVMKIVKWPVQRKGGTVKLLPN
jgi:hypothetical protein